MASSSNPKKRTNGRSHGREIAVARLGFKILSMISTRLAAKGANRLFRMVRKHPTPEREAVWIEAAEESFVDTGSQRMRVLAWGEGPTVLLVHGWEGRGSQMGAFARPLVEAGFRAVAYDAPGHGDAAKRVASLPEFARAVRAVANEFGPVAAIVAHSFGAPASALALARDPNLDVGRMVFVAAPSDLQRYVDWFWNLLGLGSAVRIAMMAEIKSRFGIDWADIRRAALVPHPNTPLLVIHDRTDTETLFAGSEEIVAAWPESRLVATEGLGHRRILRDPAVIRKVVEFVKEENGVAECDGSEDGAPRAQSNMISATRGGSSHEPRDRNLERRTAGALV